MDKQIAPTSQIFSHGGILIKDWFSDRLQQKHGTCVYIQDTNRKFNKSENSWKEQRGKPQLS